MFALKPIKFEHNELQKSYFWGCIHVFHQKEFVWKARGYNSYKEYALGIKDKINSVCTESDNLFLLGDGFLNSTPEDVEEFWFKLRPKINYIWGNHENSTTQLYRKYRDAQYNNLNKDIEIYPLTYNNVTFWGNYLEISINDHNMVLSHYPFKVWNNSKKGYWNLHSHNHGALPSSHPTANEGKILDVGVDNFKSTPVSFDEIQIIMKNKEIKRMDNHH